MRRSFRLAARKLLLGLQHRLGDSLIGAAAAEISAHAFAHAFRIVAGLTFLDQADRAHDLAWRTEPALQAVVRNKGLLHRMKPVALRHAFDGEDVSAVVTDREREARIDPPPPDEDGAGAALPAVASLLCSGQIEAFAKKIEQRDPRVFELDCSRDAVHGQSQLRSSCGAPKSSDGRSATARCCGSLSAPLPGGSVGRVCDR